MIPLLPPLLLPLLPPLLPLLLLLLLPLLPLLLLLLLLRLLLLLLLLLPLLLLLLFIPIAAGLSAWRQVHVAVLRTGASRALEPDGQVPLRIAANLRPTQLVKRLCMFALVGLSAAQGAGQKPKCKKLDQCGIVRQPSLCLSV